MLPVVKGVAVELLLLLPLESDDVPLVTLSELAVADAFALCANADSKGATRRKTIRKRAARLKAARCKYSFCIPRR